jgi:hypothetical protein
MADPSLKLGAKRVFIGTALTAAQVQDIYTNWQTGTPHIPVVGSATPHAWWELFLDGPSTYSDTLTNKTINLSTNVHGVLRIIGDMPDMSLYEATINVSDLQKVNLFNYLSPDPDFKSSTARAIPLVSKYGKDLSSDGYAVIITNMEYGAVANSTYGNQPVVGSGADPSAIIIPKASIWTTDRTNDGGNTQQLIPITIKSLAVDGTTDKGIHGFYPADLTLFANEA